MLTYAFQILQQDNYAEIATEPFEHIHDLFAAILSKGIAQQLKQGLTRDYIPYTEELSVIRGKIDLAGTMRNRAGNRNVLTCEYDELSENNIYNQIIKTIALLLLKEQDVKSELKDTLKKEMLFFAGVSEIDPRLIRWNSIRFTRNNQSYQMLLGICRLITEGLLLTDNSGEVKLAKFFDEQRMCHLYEKFILEFYKKELPKGIRAHASKIDWQCSDDGNGLLPEMQSDITLTDGDKTLIIDAKYYSHATQVQFGKHTLHSQNVYQIFTYVMNRDTGFVERQSNLPTGSDAEVQSKVAGMLLYAKTDEAITPDADVVIMKHRISAKTLDLNREFNFIAKDLKQIAKEYFCVEM